MGSVSRCVQVFLTQTLVGAAVGSRHDHLTVEYRGPSVDVPGVGSDVAEAVGPVNPAESEYFDYCVSHGID